MGVPVRGTKTRVDDLFRKITFLYKWFIYCCMRVGLAVAQRRAGYLMVSFGV